MTECGHHNTYERKPSPQHAPVRLHRDPCDQCAVRILKQRPSDRIANHRAGLIGVIHRPPAPPVSSFMGTSSRRRADRTKSNNARPTDSSCQSQAGPHETKMLIIITAASLVASSHVRSEDAVIGAVLRDGLLSSAVIQRLVDTIDDSNVIVYLARGNCPQLATACVMMAGGGPDVRYIRVNFRLPPGMAKLGVWRKAELSVAIAHELQHAVEIAGWPDVVDSATMRAAYTRSGLDRGAEDLDTDAAIRAGEDRRAELQRGRRRRTGPATTRSSHDEAKPAPLPVRGTASPPNGG